MKFRPQLSLDLTSPSSSSTSPNNDNHSFRFGQTTYRKDNFSIGQDYLRLDGRTVSRGQLSPDRLDVQHILGRGNFSTVRYAQWNRRSCRDGNDGDKENDATIATPVAVKQLCLTQTSPQRHVMLLKELRTLCLLQSEFLVTLHGAFLQEDTIFMVLEMMDQGSLQDYFQRQVGGCMQQHHQQHHHHHHQQRFLPDDFIAALSLQVLTGLAHLHDHQVIHL